MESTDEGNYSQSEEYDYFYHNAICHVCKDFNSGLKRCGGCKLYAYCSKKHQKIHWKYHKQLCKVTKALLSKGGKQRHYVLQIASLSNLSATEWRNLKLDLKILWETLLKRELTNSENQLWMFPRLCEICRNCNQDILFECKRCKSVSYCSNEHQSIHFHQHENYCKFLEISLEISINLFRYNSTLQITLSISDSVEKLPNDILEFIKNYVRVSRFKHSDILASDVISPMLSLLYALEVKQLIKNRFYAKDTCVIHLIGASLYEHNFSWCLFRELFFTWIKNLKKLTIVLIGPELLKNYPTYENLSLNKNFELVIERHLYHDYVNSKRFTTPDLMAAYNCGLHEYQSTKKDTWHLSIGSLCPRSDALLLLTAYTQQEAHFDLDRITGFPNTHIIIRAAQNPFKSHRPLPNWDPLEPPIFYNNNYISVLEKA